MKHIFSIFLLFFVAKLHAQVLEGKEARQKLAQTDLLRYKSGTSIPNFIRFTQESKIPRSELSSVLRYQLGLSAEHDLQAINQQKDKQGFVHERFCQLYKWIEVEGSMFIVHSKDQQLTALNGDIFDEIALDIVPSLTEKAAVEKAISHTKATKYMWETHFLDYKFPTGKLVIVPENGDFEKQDWHLCYKIDIYATAPLSRNWVYVDAHSGEIIWKQEQIHGADAPGSGTTFYSGVRNFTTDSFSGGYRLREAARSGIETYNMQTDTDYSNAVDFTDTDNNWTSVTNLDAAARDAHWGAEETYDYYFSHYNRNSIDDNGMKIVSYVHYDLGYVNAFWNGQFMTFGDGLSQPLTSLDVMGHELTHGVTGNTAGLIYQNEPGALNESFSDIFGTAVEFYARPAAADWLIGGDFGPLNYFRSMDDPNAKGNPDTYLGTSWSVGTADNGGVHSNSGVQNKWFYLVSMGGSGTNDLGNNYTVTGVGITDAGAIAYKSLTQYLTPSSGYIDARFYSTLAAIDLFGTCSPQLAATIDAWYAVGVGLPYQPSVTADFLSPIPAQCKPGIVTFHNYSSNANTFKWNFGDGSPTISNNNPTVTHNYTTNGSYNVTLIADGGTCGKDTTIKTSYVTVNPNNPCELSMPTSGQSTQTNCTGIVYDEGGPNLYYSPDVNGTIVIAPTNAYQVDLNFSHFLLKFDDTLFVYDGNSVNAPILGNYSLNSLAGNTISSTGPALTVRFKANSSSEDSGFVFNWACHTITAIPKVDFLADELTSCDGIIQFKDMSTQGANNWKWDFGDGTTLNNVKNPTHEYQQNGTYTVKMKAANYLGADSTEKTAYITVNRPAAPNANDAYICAGAATLTATTNNTGEINWFASNGNWIGTGDLTIANPINNSSYTAKNYEFGAFTNGGRLSSAGFGGSFVSTPNVWMQFEVTQACMLHAVDMYAGVAGKRTVVYADGTGNVLATRTVYLDTGMNKVILNIPLQVMQKAKLGISGNLINLKRNQGGSTYPYTIGNYVIIKNSSTGSSQQYFYFYNWELADMPCVSLPKSVQVFTGGTAPQAQFSYNITQNTVTFDASASTNAPAFVWDFGDGTTGTGLMPTHTYTALGTYNVNMIAQNGGCKDYLSQTITITTLGLGASTLSQSLQLFPNPGSGNLFVKWNDAQNANISLTIYNNLGQAIWTEKYMATYNEVQEIVLPTSTEGLYWVQIQVGEEFISLPYHLKW